jgi:hypothetical protein
MNVLPKFYNAHPARKIEVKQEQQDDLEYYVIENVLCPLHRTQSWLKRHDLDSPDSEKAIEKIRTETSTLKLLVIIVTNEASQTKDLLRTIYSLIHASQLHPIKFLSIIKNPEAQIRSKEIIEVLDDQYFGQWQIRHLVSNSNYWRIINSIRHSTKYQYMVVIHTGDTIDERFFIKLHDLVYDWSKIPDVGLLQIKHNNNKNLINVIPAAVYEHVRFHYGFSRPEKTETDTLDMVHLIKQWAQDAKLEEHILLVENTDHEMILTQK